MNSTSVTKSGFSRDEERSGGNGGVEEKARDRNPEGVRPCPTRFRRGDGREPQRKASREYPDSPAKAKPMTDVVFFVAVGWMTLLFSAGVVLVIRRESAVDKIQALDVLSLILVALLVLFADSQESSYYLDVALIVSLLSFVAIIAAARYFGRGRIF
jgi:multicomponent Na+:H+ antiporter subunit F